MAKDYLNEKNVVYTDYNVAEDMEKRAEMVKKSGQMGVPVIQIDNELFVGFQKDKINELLGITE